MTLGELMEHKDYPLFKKHMLRGAAVGAIAALGYLGTWSAFRIVDIKAHHDRVENYSIGKTFGGQFGFYADESYQVADFNDDGQKIVKDKPFCASNSALPAGWMLLGAAAVGGAAFGAVRAANKRQR